MGEFSIWHWLIVLLVVMLLFGSGKVSTLMGDFAKGIKAFKKNMAEDDAPAASPRAELSLVDHASAEQAPETISAPGPVSDPARNAVPNPAAADRETTPAH